MDPPQSIRNLKSQINDIISEITYHRQQLQIVKSESEATSQELNMKIDEMSGRIELEEHKIQKLQQEIEHGKRQRVVLSQKIKVLCCNN